MLRLAAWRRRALLLGVGMLALTTASVRADDWTTTNGKVYRNVTVLSHTTTTVTILDSDGGATISLLDLPPALQQKFGIDRKAAQAIRDQENAVVAKAAADEKAKADAQAASDKADRDKKAETVAAMAQENDEFLKKLESFNAKATADYAAAEKVTIASEVSYLTTDKQTIPMASTRVRLYGFDQIHAAIDSLGEHGGDEDKKLDPALATEKAACLSLGADVVAAKPGAPHDAAKKKWDDAAKSYRDTLTKYYSYSSQDYYADHLPPPVAETKTTPDGAFTLPIPKTGSWVLVARGQHPTVGGGGENCLWIAKIKPEDIAKNQVALNNDNLSGDDSLMNAVSDPDIAALIQRRLDETLQK